MSRDPLWFDFAPRSVREAHPRRRRAIQLASVILASLTVIGVLVAVKKPTETLPEPIFMPTLPPAPASAAEREANELLAANPGEVFTAIESCIDGDARLEELRLSDAGAAASLIVHLRTSTRLGELMTCLNPGDSTATWQVTEMRRGSNSAFQLSGDAADWLVSIEFQATVTTGGQTK